ncbi:hypothetical protein [Gimesia aquarii]|uniref:Uncharacterized protein n=1 Tax=Gimesia aquarii TaxID=2527964 RepID=A0A517VWR0_9PLAN|nr:hypothetical protein [Gimesia aquarii]QDT97437.1 hypothetical protein V144x_29120 [Gimesia aquarii]
MIQKRLFYLWLFFFLAPGALPAQTFPLVVDIRQLSQFPKGNGPVSFVWQCQVSATGLLEGYFLVTVHDGVEKFGTFRSHDVAMHAGFHEIPMMLPPMKVDNPYSEVKLKLSFVTPNQQYDFKDEYSLRVGQRFQRTFAVGVCDPFDMSMSKDLKEFLERLDFESISPKEPIKIDFQKLSRSIPNVGMLRNQPLSLNVKTVSIHLPPPDYPQLPIDCHQYDILVITARGFAQLESRNLKAIHQWVRSGGSLCLLAGPVLEQRQVQFMNDLVETKNAPPFLIDSEGKLVMDQSEQVWSQRTGWGRSVIVLSEALKEKRLTASELKQIPFFLWKLRESQRSYFDKQEKWDYEKLVDAFIKTQKRTDYRNMNAYSANQVFNLNYRPISTGGAVVTDLMPAELRIVPSWVIASILLGYVLIIGPGEYFILGKFRLRRFTWITFPIISICIACLAFIVSDHYMQTSYERKLLTIHDLDRQGKPVKENQIELLFTGSYQKIETNIKSGLFTPLNHTELGMAQNYNMYARNRVQSLVGPPLYAGSIPTQYSVYQLMPQWTPQLNRIIKNYPDELQTKFDWSSIQLNQLRSNQGRVKIRKQIKTAFGNRAKVMVYQGQKNGEVKKHPLFKKTDNPRNRNNYRSEQDYALFNEYYQNYPHYYGNNRLRRNSFMDDLCVRSQNGLFQIVSQTSPSGGQNYEDLSILDPSDPSQWLVVVYVPGNEQDTIYRQLIVAEK